MLDGVDEAGMGGRRGLVCKVAGMKGRAADDVKEGAMRRDRSCTGEGVESDEATLRFFALYAGAMRVSATSSDSSDDSSLISPSSSSSPSSISSSSCITLMNLLVDARGWRGGDGVDAACTSRVRFDIDDDDALDCAKRGAIASRGISSP